MVAAMVRHHRRAAASPLMNLGPRRRGVAALGSPSFRRAAVLLLSSTVFAVAAWSVPSAAFCGIQTWSAWLRSPATSNALDLAQRQGRGREDQGGELGRGRSAYSRLTRRALQPGRYKALTRIRVRKAPDVAAEATDRILNTDEEFEAVEVSQGTGSGDRSLTYLKIGGEQGGWVFDQGISGRWEGKRIVQAVMSAGATREPPAASSEEAVDTAFSFGDAPLRRLNMPAGALGGHLDYITLEVDGKELNFLISTLQPFNSITDRGCQRLGVALPQFSGGWLSAAASQQQGQNVDLKKVRVPSGASLGDFNNIAVMAMAQEPIAEAQGIELHGVLGCAFLQKYDVELDRYGGVMRIYQPGELASTGISSSLRHMPALGLPGDILGFSASAALASSSSSGFSKPFVAMVDTGMPFSVMNWQAAELMGIARQGDPAVTGSAETMVTGRNGKPIPMPILGVRFKLKGVPPGVKPMIIGLTKEEFDKYGGKGWYIDSESLEKGAPPGELQFGCVYVAVGEFFQLRLLEDSAVGRFDGPAVLLGQDAFSQPSRIVFNYQSKNMWLQEGIMVDAPPPM